MAKKRKESPKKKIIRLYTTAFNEAAIGNEGKARGLWEDAINAGFNPDPKTVKGFEIAIEKGLRDTRR